MARLIRSLVASAALIAFLPAMAAAQAPAPSDEDPAPMQFGGWGVNLEELDPAVDPGDDFDAYVNGKWKARTEIPAKYSWYGVVTNLRIGSERAVKGIIDELSARQPAAGSTDAMVRDIFAAYNDVDAINRAGLTPLQPYLQRINSVSNYEELASLWGNVGYPAPMGGGIGPDRGDPKNNILYFGFGGIGLPDRDNYLVDNERNREMRAKYLDLATFFLEKAGHPKPRAAAESVYALEHKIAAAMWDRAIARNPLLTTNRLSHSELIALGNGFPMQTFLETLGLNSNDRYNVSNIPPTAEEIEAASLTPEQLAKLGEGLPGMTRLITETPLDVWKAWMTIRLIQSNADILPTDIDDANFAFYGTYLNGQKKKRDRWQRAVSEVESNVGEALGKAYVDRYFPPQSKAAMDELVGNLRLAMAENLKDLPWMTPATRAAAKAKLDQLRVKIGYPVKFETYEGLQTSPTDVAGNRLAAAKWQWAKDLRDLRKPVDPEQWFMTPQTVNAYYAATMNEMAYPAAYLQAPNFGPSFDPAVNYGAIGATIGHEIGHGFDDNGSRYDGTGTLKNWWTAEDKATFQKLGEKLIAQYDKICPLDEGKTCINGRLTLGENIGDLGGLSMAYRAYKIALNGKEAPVIDGLTGDQRFFISYAQHQRGKYRDEFLRQLIQTDPHSPDFARINAVLRNFDPWYEAFNVTADDELYLPPAERVRIW